MSLARIDNIHELALDYDDLIDSLGLEGFSLIGHSFGAMIAAEIAAHFPGRAERLVLLAPFGLWNDAYPVADIFAMPYTQIDDILWHDQAARERFAPKLVPSADPKEAAAQMVRLAGSLTAVTKFVWPIPDRGLHRRLPRIACPTLVLFGAEDRVVSPRYAEDFKAGLRHGETAVVAGRRPHAALREAGSRAGAGRAVSREPRPPRLPEWARAPTARSISSSSRSAMR